MRNIRLTGLGDDPTLPTNIGTPQQAEDTVIGTLATVGGAIALYTLGVDAKTLSFVGAALVAASVVKGQTTR